MGMSSVYPWSQGDRGLLRVPEGELGTFYQHSRRGSNDHDCWEFRCSFFRFQVSGPMDNAYDSAQFVFVEDVDACTALTEFNTSYRF